ncbi:MAG: hypothetical protein AAF997_04305 [Myxococcota bacterium]
MIQAMPLGAEPTRSTREDKTHRFRGFRLGSEVRASPDDQNFLTYLNCMIPLDGDEFSGDAGGDCIEAFDAGLETNC